MNRPRGHGHTTRYIYRYTYRDQRVSCLPFVDTATLRDWKGKILFTRELAGNPPPLKMYYIGRYVRRYGCPTSYLFLRRSHVCAQIKFRVHFRLTLLFLSCSRAVIRYTGPRGTARRGAARRVINFKRHPNWSFKGSRPSSGLFALPWGRNFAVRPDPSWSFPTAILYEHPFACLVLRLRESLLDGPR